MSTPISVDQALAPAFLSLTFPAMRPTLLMAGVDPDVITVGAHEEGVPVALLLARKEGDCIEVLSIMTVPGCRARGIARELMASLDRLGRGAGASWLQIKYMSGRPSEAALNRLLDSTGWGQAVPRMKFLRAKARPLGDAPRWIQLCKAPLGMNAFAWQDLEKTTGRRHYECGPWVPPELNPFTPHPLDPPFDRDTSLGLEHRGEVVGWIITHRISADTVRYSQWCIHPDLRRGSAGPFLLAEAIRCQLTRTDAAWLQLGVFVDNRTMLRFLDRHLAGYFEEPFFSMVRARQLR